MRNVIIPTEVQEDAINLCDVYLSQPFCYQCQKPTEESIVSNTTGHIGNACNHVSIDNNTAILDSQWISTAF